MEPRTEKKILIVEDDFVSLNLLESVFRMKGYPTVSAKTGKEALQIVYNDNGIWIILMDIQLPDMGGLDATVEIRKKFKEIPIIAQTAYAYPHDKERSLKAGCTDYITKPIKIGELMVKLEKYL